MALGIIGKKVGMTRMFNTKGRSIPCTVLQAGPCVVTQIKTAEKDRYEAVQLGYGEKKAKNTPRAEQKHFEKAKTTPKKRLVEFKDFATHYPTPLQLGDVVQVSDVLQEGDTVHISGTSKGKGFQGVVKRHGFSGVGERTHGQHNRERAPGAIGACSTPSRVYKNMRMAGRMGGEKSTVQGLKIMKIIPEENLVVVSGSVPGANNSDIKLKKA